MVEWHYISTLFHGKVVAPSKAEVATLQFAEIFIFIDVQYTAVILAQWACEYSEFVAFTKKVGTQRNLTASLIFMLKYDLVTIYFNRINVAFSQWSDNTLENKTCDVMAYTVFSCRCRLFSYEQGFTKIVTGVRKL